MSSSSRPPPSTPALSELDRLAQQLSLPPNIITVAHNILQATTSTSPDPYFAACAIYVAMASTKTPSQLPLSTLLTAATGQGRQLLITDFFRRAKLIAADAATMLSTPPPINPAPLVHASHHAFMTSAQIFRKLTDLVSHPTLLHPSPDTTRAVWLLFLVAKEHLTASSSPLPPVNIFHLLLATLSESGLVRSKTPTAALASATKALPTEISRYQSLLSAALPPSIRTHLPLHQADISAISAALDSEYAALLSNPQNQNRLLADERVFVDAPHLLPQPHLHTPPTTPSPSRKRRLPHPPALPQTPRTRAHLLREKMALTPRRPSRFAPFIRPVRGADALDALAAVASSAPHSPALTKPSRPRLPPTPMSAGCAAVSWLQHLADSRPETAKEDMCLICPAEDVSTSQALQNVVNDPARSTQIVQFVRMLSNRLEEAVPHLADAPRKREAMAVFFASLENILVKEINRLKDKPKWIADNLVKATSIHKSILLCSWEITSAAYGRRDLAMFNAAISAFEEPPLDIVKAIESFVTLPDMPRALAAHMITCGNRVLEAMAWKAGSKLVADLKQRASEKALGNTSPTSTTNDGTSADPHAALSDEKSDQFVPNNAVREFTLEYFFRKLLSVASERAQELLIRLGMDAIAEPVWASIKYAVWEKWHLMVDRHLDQVIMCCVYGVAKVRRYELKFREIIQAYQNMSHVRESSFSHMVPGVFRDVCLDSHLDLMPPTDDATRKQRPSTSTDTKGMRGDIIKLYNKVFIHAMKAHILQFQVAAATATAGVMSVRNLVGPGSSPADSQNRSSVVFPTSTSNTLLSGAGSSENSRMVTSDKLNEKVMSSPMRMLRPHASPRRIGRVTVSPMSPGGRSLVAIRQSPGQRTVAGIMTPGTRKMYAFGESPVRSLDHINLSLAQSSGGSSSYETGRGKFRRSVPLVFEGNGVGQRRASMRKLVENVGLPKKSLRSQVGSVRNVSTSDRMRSGASTAAVLPKANNVETHSNGMSDGSAKPSAAFVRSPAN